MSPFLLQFANGNIFFIGLIMVAAGTDLQLRRNGRIVRLLLVVNHLVGLSFVILSATPLPMWAYLVWLLVALGGFIVSNVRDDRKGLARLRPSVPALAIFCSLAMILIEIPFHVAPSIRVSPERTVFVLGDSISAGIGTKERPWPVVLGEISHLRVVNLAQAGSTVEMAIKQSSRVSGPDPLVIVEIGGNDLIGGSDPRKFRDGLHELLARLDAGTNQLVMFELPLFPLKNGYGNAQRSLAREFHVTLIPKNVLTRVFGPEGNTVDGLHLTQQGHDALAKSVYRMLKMDGDR